MAPTLASQWRAFWHTMTSEDRHAGPDSPYRIGQHVPLSQSKNAPLTSVSTSALGSHTDLNADLEAGNGGFVSHPTNGTASPPYSPGTRKTLQRQSSGMDSKMEAIGQGEIQMQSFSDGLPPPPPVSHSWKRIDRWLEDNYEELWENLGAPATINDVNELEHELDCSLPQEVRESLQLHDGQERGGMPTGIVFGCMLLDCEEIQQEWQNWRTVNEAYFNDQQRTYSIPQAPLKAFAGASSSPTVPVAQPQQPANTQWRAELQDKQDSQPPNSIQKVYAHPAWIPLARDWGGNNIAVDLAPGPTGKWGQIILMGRDYDCKYVISRSWSAFLATLADDMSTDKWFIDDDTRELKLREFKQPGVEPAYIDILRWRADQKYGRRMPRKRPLRMNTNVSSGGGQQNGYSPYASPTSEDRGRSPNRYSNGNGKAAAGSSPRGSHHHGHHHNHVGSPLARVTEESAPASNSTNSTNSTRPLKLDTSNVDGKSEKLISGIDSPRSALLLSAVGEDTGERRGSFPFPKSRLGDTSVSAQDDSDGDDETGVGDGEGGEMKEVKI